MRDIKKIFFLFMGILLVILGIIGVLLPVIPGIPFFIMAIMFFSKGSIKFIKWTLNNKYLGPLIRKFRKKGLNKTLRNFTLTTVWISHSISIYLFKNLYTRIILLILLVSVTWVLLVVKTYDPHKNN